MDKGLIVHAVLFNDKKEILLIRRSLNETVLPGVWDIPGGTLEDGEDPRDGAIRETSEETGVAISDLSLFAFTSNVDAKKNKQFVRLIFIGQVDDTNIQVTLNPEDHDMYRWVSIDDIPGDVQLVDYLNDIASSLRERTHKILSFR